MRNLSTAAAIGFFALLAGIGGHRPAAAGFINDSTGIADPAVTITFDEHVFADGSAVTGQYSDLGVIEFTNLYFHNFPSGDHVNSNPDVVGNFLWNLAPGTGYVNSFEIDFAVPQTAAAFAISGFAVSAQFTALLGGTVVDTGNASIGNGSGDTNDFYGFSGESFDAIQVTASGSFIADIDNIQLATTPVPEPASIAVWSVVVGVAGFVGLRRRVRNC